MEDDRDYGPVYGSLDSHDDADFGSDQAALVPHSVPQMELWIDWQLSSKSCKG
jgi:hypothetical protein